MEKHKKGTVSELLAMVFFKKNEYIVSKPISDFNEYDLIIDNGSLWRVQVKTVYWDNSKHRYLISLVTSHIRGKGRKPNKKYTQKSFDVLCAVCEPENAIYVIPIKEIIGRRSITLYPTDKPKTVSKIHKDFEHWRLQ